jgi:CBS domain-containing protein
MTPASEHANSRATVADAMIHSPKICGPATTVAHAREQFRNDHVHAVLVVDNGQLVAVVERPDINSAPPDLPARLTGRLHGRVTTPDADLEATRRAMTTHQRRRLAIIDDGGTLLGLLCLKRTGTGFCSDADVQARADEGRNLATRTPPAARPRKRAADHPSEYRAPGTF